jgi:hypothetical protein
VGGSHLASHAATCIASTICYAVVPPSMCTTTVQTIDWLQDANNGQALFVKGLADLCTAQPGGVALLARAEEEGDLQASYALAIIKYYKHDVTDDVFNHIWHVYSENTFGLQVGTRWWMEYKACDEDEARVLGVRK